MLEVEPYQRLQFGSPSQFDVDVDLQENHIAERVNAGRDEMPVDYASYLLSASPPGFDLNLHYSLRDHFGEDGRIGDLRLRQPQDGPPRSIMLNKLLAEEKEAEVSSSSSLVDDMGHLELEDTCQCCDVLDTTGDASNASCSCKESRLLTSAKSMKRGDNNHRLRKKTVSFADDVGLSLVSVRILTESTDMPPKLRPEILSSLTQGASASVTEAPPLVLNFSQPASEYLAFREKIDRNCVSLENVILKDYKLLGTVKVKNIAFEKSVTVRCTFDGWEHIANIPAKYVPIGEETSRSPYDTFSFEINVPPTMDVHNKVHFAICYEAAGQQFWDSNNGKNYEVVSANWRTHEDAKNGIAAGTSRGPTPRANFSIGEEEQWSEFSAWSNVDNEVPYW